MSEIGQSIIRGAKEALAYTRGEPVEVPVTLDARAIRANLSMTQRASHWSKWS